MNTKLLPPDPDELNDDRAEWAGEAIDAFAAAVYAERNTEDDTTILADLLANLRHWADRNAVDFDSAMVQAICHYADETMPEVVPPAPLCFAHENPVQEEQPHPVENIIAAHIKRCSEGG